MKWQNTSKKQRKKASKELEGTVTRYGSDIYLTADEIFNLAENDVSWTRSMILGEICKKIE